PAKRFWLIIGSGSSVWNGFNISTPYHPLLFLPNPRNAKSPAQYCQNFLPNSECCAFGSVHHNIMLGVAFAIYVSARRQYAPRQDTRARWQSQHEPLMPDHSE
ncbi:MAG: hypothetical protein ABL893_03805, partial [Hyphomicrobium sp.]